MYKLLIIDDDWIFRKDSYQSLLRKEDGFELVFLENSLIDLSLIDDSTIDSIILDLSLDYPKTHAEENLRIVLKRIGNKKPIILVSRKFNELASWVKYPKDYNVNVIDYFGWSEIFSASGKIKNEDLINTTILRIKCSLDDFFYRTKSRKSLDEKITILFLADLQFGDPNFSDDTLLSELILARHLIKEKIYPDLIVVAGDIVYSASPEEYLLAENWLEKLSNLLFEKNDNFYERVIVVPGNHDVNLTLCTANNYEFDFDHYLEGKFLKDRVKPLNDFKLYGLYPFCDFAYKITRDSRWIHKHNNLYWINERFYNWGIRLVIANTVTDLTHVSPKNFDLSDSSISQLALEIDNDTIDKVFTIIVGHNGPDDLGYSMGNNKDRRIKSLFSLINGVGANMYLHGHRHKPSKKYKKEYAGPYTDNIEYVMCGTMNLNKVREHDTRRSFSIIELYRKDGNVHDSKVRIFEIEEQDIREKP